jgi:hypothetical protein
MKLCCSLARLLFVNLPDLDSSGRLGTSEGGPAEQDFSSLVDPPPPVALLFRLHPRSVGSASCCRGFFHLKLYLFCLTFLIYFFLVDGKGLFLRQPMVS